ncbi:MAG: PH domain-containing protein [Phycisphaerae bacterium]|nr:PH domain-containing protein [Gemmatimonadaceae bacterium]
MSTYLKGVEMPLPEGERVLWQGSPQFRDMAVHAFHARKIAIYFLGLIALTAFLNRDAPSFLEAMMSSAGLLALGGLMAVAFAVTVAMLSSRTTLYAITDKRVVMKVGIALPIVLNIPLRVIESVGIKQRSNGSGNISLRLANKSRVAYAVLWPHARPWRIRYPEPLLRDLPAIAAVGETLRAALLASAESGSEESTVVAATSTGTQGNIVLAAS